jgi:hypothetical protein
MRRDGKIDDLAWPFGDVTRAKAVCGTAFCWSLAEPASASAENARGATPLPALRAHDPEAMPARIEAAGATIVEPISAFPGGRRFHVEDPAGTGPAAGSDR